MHDNIIAQLKALQDKPAPDLKRLWKELYGTEPPPFNKVYYLKRLSYRIQELTYGVDSRPLEKRLETYARQHMNLQGAVIKKQKNTGDRPIAGTRLMREYGGEEHHVTVLHHGFDYRGRRYKSLSSIARVITGTQWSGPIFFGLKRGGAA